MNHLNVADITSYTMPAEITTLELAVAWYRRNLRLANSLPSSAPAKLKKAWTSRISLAKSLIDVHFFLRSN